MSEIETDKTIQIENACRLTVLISQTYNETLDAIVDTAIKACDVDPSIVDLVRTAVRRAFNLGGPCEKQAATLRKIVVERWAAALEAAARDEPKIADTLPERTLNGLSVSVP